MRVRPEAALGLAGFCLEARELGVARVPPEPPRVPCSDELVREPAPIRRDHVRHQPAVSVPVGRFHRHDLPEGEVTGELLEPYPERLTAFWGVDAG